MGMKMEIYCLMTLLTMAFAKPYTSIDDTTEFSLTPTSRSQFKACLTKRGEEGRCVHNSYCNDDTYKIEVGGIISESELRSFDCIAEVEWCCSDKNITKITSPSKRRKEVNCSVSDRPDCPWCVKLYRDGEDGRKLDSGLFCMGTLIGTNVVLSTGTCLLQAQGQKLWATIPNSDDPDATYIIKFRQVHPDYNSGTRAYDLALFVLDRDEQWGENTSKGACIGIQYPLEGECMGAGVDDDENIHMTPLLVNTGTCGSGSKVDASCGHLIGEQCTLFPGSPIMCRANNGYFVVSGLAKLPCLHDPPKALLGNLNKPSKWLHAHLKGTMGLLEKNYLPN